MTVCDSRYWRRDKLTPQLLNTISNLGGTLPKPIILRSVDVLTKATCYIPTKGQLAPGDECVSEHGKLACHRSGGECVLERDGYYIMSVFCVTLGAMLLIGFILPTVKRLQCKFSSATMFQNKLTSSPTDECLEGQDT